VSVPEKAKSADYKLMRCSEPSGGFKFMFQLYKNRQASAEQKWQVPSMEKKLLSIHEAAEILSCSTRTIRRLIEERTIGACKVRNSTRVVSMSLMTYILTIISDYRQKYGSAKFKSSK